MADQGAIEAALRSARFEDVASVLDAQELQVGVVAYHSISILSELLS